MEQILEPLIGELLCPHQRYNLTSVYFSLEVYDTNMTSLRLAVLHTNERIEI